MNNRESCLLPTRCEHCKYTAEHTVQYRGKRIMPYTYYCTAERRVKTIGTRFDWAGISPDFCPKRKEAAGGSETERVRDGRADSLDAGHTAEA